MLQLDFKPNFNSMEPMLSEPTLDTLRVQAIKLYRRKYIIIAMGCLLLALIMGGAWWYYATSPLAAKILEQAGTYIEDGLEEVDSLPPLLKEESPPFKVQVIDDCLLYAQAEGAFLQKNWPLAIKKYKALIKLYTHHQALWFNLALACHHNGDLEQARYWYEKVLYHQPQHTGAKHNLHILDLECFRS